MNKMFFFPFLSAIVFSTFSFAAKISNADAKVALLETLEKYANQKAIILNIEKVDDKVALGTKVKSQGVLKYSKNKIFMQLEGDSKSEMFYKNKKVTLVEYPDKDFDENGNRKVTILTKNSPAVTNSFINLFSNPSKFVKDFKITSAEKTLDKNLKIKFKPKIKNLEKLQLIINPEEKLIAQVDFTDDVKTETVIQINKTEFKETLSSKTFEYKQLKTDQVHTE